MTSSREANIQAASDALENGEFPSIRAAAEAYGLDHSTLSRRLRGGRTRREAREEQQLLSPAQEEVLKRWIVDLHLAGASPSFAQVREFAGLISHASGGPSLVGHNWVARFLNRHKDIKSKVGRKTEYLRAENTSPQDLQVVTARE